MGIGPGLTAGSLASSWRSLLRPPYGRLLVLVCAASALGGLLASASVFVIDFMQTQRHLSASAASLILVGADALAIPVLLGAGSISDRVGRKRPGCSFLALSVAGTLCFFFLARGPAGLFLALAITYVGQFGAWPTLTGFSTELFPTSHRALASSAAAIARVAGTCISFVLAALLIGLTGSLARSVALLAAGPLLALVIVAAGFPETAGRELEQTSGGVRRRSAARSHPGSKPSGIRPRDLKARALTARHQAASHTPSPDIGNRYCPRPPRLDCAIESICGNHSYVDAHRTG